MLPPNNVPLCQLAKEEGISEATYTIRRDTIDTARNLKVAGPFQTKQNGPDK